MGVNKAIGIFLPPNAKVELAVNYGGGGGEAALFFDRNNWYGWFILWFFIL